MTTCNTFYVRVAGASPISAIQRRFPEATIEPGEEFIGVILSRGTFEPPIAQLAELSIDLSTDVIWLSFQSVFDAFEFHHWRRGKVLRSLVFGCYEEERTWEWIEGEPEHWERAAFFDPDVLQHSLKFMQTAEEKCELERIWSKTEILLGRTEPSIDSRETAWKVAEYYNFPGWS